jgi:hypothetical protein
VTEQLRQDKAEFGERSDQGNTFFLKATVVI